MKQAVINVKVGGQSHTISLDEVSEKFPHTRLSTFVNSFPEGLRMTGRVHTEPDHPVFCAFDEGGIL